MISIIIPFHNEEKNVSLLYHELKLNLAGHEHEVVFVDDGSTDQSLHNLRQVTSHDPTVKIISHKKKLGKGKALVSGLSQALGGTIIFMDADCQDNPQDIPLFLEKLNGGFDVVNGWRFKRQDGGDKTIPSKIANTILWQGLLNTKLHDVNCGFKAFRREVLAEIPLYGDNYRFIPVLAEKQGFQVTEVVVNHRPRQHGRSKYSAARIFSGLLDTISTYFIMSFSEKPLHFFGLIGGVFLISGFFTSGYFIFERVFHGILLYRRPAFLLSLVMLVIGLQIVLTGIVAELIVYLNKKKNI